MKTIISSYWKVFRLMFVIFSLYLMGDAFYRWDGFRYYASLSEFIPSVALITILWTVVAIFLAFLIWACGIVFEYISHKKIKIEHLFSFVSFIVLVGALIFILKNAWPRLISAFQIKFFLIIAIASLLFITWLLRDIVIKWFDIVQKRITPLVWIFGAFFFISIPVVMYQTWIIQSNNGESLKLTQPTSFKDKKLNIILVSFDALSARNMSLYGYSRITTPFIEQWSKNASVFTNLHAESVSTRPTSESMMTGKRVWTHGTYGLENYYDKSSNVNIENIAYVLKNNGYYNVALTQNYLASPKRMGIADSFNEIIANQFYDSSSLLSKFEKNMYLFFGNKIILHDWILKKDFVVYYLLDKLFLKDLPVSRNRTDLVFSKALDILNHDIPQPFFMWIHLLPPHDPYAPPESYVGIYGASTVTSQASKIGRIYRAGDIYSPEELKQLPFILRARYDEFIRYCDNQFYNFIINIENKDIVKDTVLVLSADHGEIISSTKIGHGKDLDEPETHIPLVIKEPDQVKGQVIDDLVEQIDIPATILNLTNISIPLWMEGRSLKPFLRGESIIPRPSFSMRVVENPSHGPISKGQIAVWEGNYKLIHNISNGNSRLYNLKNDPDELSNLFTKEPATGQYLLTLIQDNLKKANEKILRGE